MGFLRTSSATRHSKSPGALRSYRPRRGRRPADRTFRSKSWAGSGDESAGRGNPRADRHPGRAVLTRDEGGHAGTVQAGHTDRAASSIDPVQLHLGRRESLVDSLRYAVAEYAWRRAWSRYSRL